MKSKEQFLCTVLLANILTFMYSHRENIIKNCLSEWPSLRSTQAREKESDQRTNSSAKCNMNHDQLMRAPAIFSKCTRHSATSLIYVYTRHSNKLHTLRRNHIKLHIRLKYPYYLNNPITLSTHRKQQQQAEHQPKQQTSQKQKKAQTVMTMTTGYLGKQSGEEVRKE
jgi:hypothetical protein